MVRYFYLWTPVFVVLGTFLVLSSPYLALIVLMLLVPATLVAAAWALVAVPRALVRAVRSRIRNRTATGTAAAALTPVERRDA
jgi:hypothetical protein